MNSVSIGRCIILDPTEEDILESKRYKEKLQAKLEELDQKAYDIAYFCSLSHFHMSIEEISKCIDEVVNIENERIEICGARFMYPRPNPYRDFLNTLKECMNLKVPSWYHIPVSASSSEIVNGFQLYEIDELPNKSIYLYTDFLELEKLYNTPNTMTEEEFMEKYDEEACSDWSKQDECGECFGGFHNYPEGSYEREHAYTLSRNANGKALYKLPYSHDLIFKSIEIGCSNRRESVRYTNTLCEYVRRKLLNKEKETDHCENKSRIPYIKVDIQGTINLWKNFNK